MVLEEAADAAAALEITADAMDPLALLRAAVVSRVRAGAVEVAVEVPSLARFAGGSMLSCDGDTGTGRLRTEAVAVAAVGDLGDVDVEAGACRAAAVGETLAGSFAKYDVICRGGIMLRKLCERYWSCVNWLALRSVGGLPWSL